MGFIPDFNDDATEGYADNHTLSIQHRRIEEKADGTKNIFERNLDFADTKVLDGGKWLISAKPNFFDRDKDHLHRNKKEQSLMVTERTIFDDGRGNKTVTENAFKMEDSKIIKGTKLIGNKPEISHDKRPDFFQPFQKSTDIFGLFPSQNKNNQLPKG
jgi:hypothetical protein